MNEYKKTMEKIQVPPELKAKTLERIEQEKNVLPKKSPWIKVAGIAASLTLIVAVGFAVFRSSWIQSDLQENSHAAYVQVKDGAFHFEEEPSDFIGDRALSNAENMTINKSLFEDKFIAVPSSPGGYYLTRETYVAGEYPYAQLVYHKNDASYKFELSSGELAKTNSEYQGTPIYASHRNGSYFVRFMAKDYLVEIATEHMDQEEFLKLFKHYYDALQP